jgi:DNA processing protein
VHLDTAFRFAAELGQAPLSILGGLQEGIDTAAHEGAWTTGAATLAVCAAGLDCIHPARSARLAARVAAAGCLVSLFPPGTPVRRYHFALRNRLIAGLATAVLAIEADAGPGGLSLVREAQRLGRRVFAVPGSIRDPRARACNLLIRAGATLVQQSDELLRDMNLFDIQRVRSTATQRPAVPPLDNKYEMLLDAAGFEPVDIDELALRTGYPGHVVAAMLLLLELRGRVAPQPGGRFCRLS